MILNAIFQNIARRFPELYFVYWRRIRLKFVKRLAAFPCHSYIFSIIVSYYQDSTWQNCGVKWPRAWAFCPKQWWTFCSEDMFFNMYTSSNTTSKWNWHRITENNFVKCEIIANFGINCEKITSDYLTSMTLKLHENRCKFRQTWLIGILAR